MSRKFKNVPEGAKLIWGECKLYNDEIPVIELKVKDSDIIVGYLSPFRCYRFQVSGTFDGQGDYGCTEVIGLANCIIDKIYDGYNRA